MQVFSGKSVKKTKKLLCFSIKSFDKAKKMWYSIIAFEYERTQKYPSGSRGSPAKGVASLSVARVQISSSAPKKRTPFGCPFFWC